MVDLATLGLAVDSRQVRQASDDLSKFARTATDAERAASKTVETMAKGKPGATAFAQGFAQADAAQRNYTSSANKVVDSLSNQFIRLNSTERQWRIYQNTQRAGVSLNSEAGQAIAKMTGALYDMEQAQNRTTSSAERMVNSLTKRVVFAFIAAQAKEAVQAIINLNSEIANLGDVGRRTGMGNDLTQGLAAAAGNRGIGQSQFLDDMVKFSREVAESRRGLNDLARLMEANGIQASTTEQAFMAVADMVKNARTEADKFKIAQEAGLNPTRQMIRFLEQGADAIRRQASESLKFSDEQIRAAQGIEDRWNEFWTRWVQRGKAAVLAVFATTDNVDSFSGVDDPFNPPRGSTPAVGSPGDGSSITAEELKRNEAIQRRVQDMQIEARLAAEITTIGQQQVEMERFKLDLQRQKIPLAEQELLVAQKAAQQAAALDTARKQSMQARQIDAGLEIERLNMEISLTRATAEEIVRARKEFELYAAAKRQAAIEGRELHEEEIEQIQRLAQEFATTTRQLDRANAANARMRTGAKISEEALIDCFSQAKVAAEAFEGNLVRIGDRLVDIGGTWANFDWGGDNEFAVGGRSQFDSGGYVSTDWRIMGRDEYREWLKKQTEATQDNTTATQQLTSTFRDILSPLYTTDPRQSHLGFRTFADGGIMTGYGEMPLRKYADGGVANSPQIAMFGEGSGPEAFIPLKNGGVPVHLRGGQPITIDARQTIIINGSADDKAMEQFGRTNFQRQQGMMKMIGGRG